MTTPDYKGFARWCFDQLADDEMFVDFDRDEVEAEMHSRGIIEPRTVTDHVRYPGMAVCYVWAGEDEDQPDPDQLSLVEGA